MLYFRYHNTNCFFVLSPKTSKLLAIDAGWPCTFHEYLRNLKLIGFGIKDVQCAIVTHFHLDHAGLISEFLGNGIICYVFENQLECSDQMERTILKGNEYHNYPLIDKERLIKISIADFNVFLHQQGFNGEVVKTTGHSEDSVSYLTDNQGAIIGDLPPFDQLMPDDFKCHESWKLIREKGAKNIFPAHAPFFLI